MNKLLLQMSNVEFILHVLGILLILISGIFYEELGKWLVCACIITGSLTLFNARYLVKVEAYNKGRDEAFAIKKTWNKTIITKYDTDDQ